MDRQQMKDMNRERQKCLQDPVYFLEKYWKIDGKSVTLTGVQKQMVREYCSGNPDSQFEDKPNLLANSDILPLKDRRRGFDISRLK